MDNLTHSLVGVLVAETTWQLQPDKAKKNLRPLLWFASIVANNFPDLDMLYAPITSGRLGYLLHHRGHTHTLVGGLLQSLFLAVFFYWIAKRQEYSKRQTFSLLLMVFLGPVIHIFLDFLNSYGVHPFWPWNNHWFYGDVLFILEPWLWLTLLPLLLFNDFKRSIKITGGILTTVTFGLIWFTGFIPWTISSLMTLFFGFYGITTSFIGLKWRLRILWGMTIIILTTFSLASYSAKRIVSQKLNAEYPLNTIEDMVLSPLPANPICWRYISVEKNATDYHSNQGLVSILPKIMPLKDCSNSDLFKDGHYQYPLSDLKKLSNNCLAKAYFIFTRVPYVEKIHNKTLLNDIRFLRNPRGDFSTLLVEENPTSCPKNIPPWVPPRESFYEK
jgi:inner membrane protein